MRWKWFVAAGFLVIIILIAAVIVYLHAYDYNRLKPQIAGMIEDATGRTLSLGGDIKLEIGFGPTLVVTDVALANASWGSQPQMLEIEKLQARMWLLPLLIRDLDIKYIRLSGVKVLLEKGPNSLRNWEFHAGSNSAGSTEAFKPTVIEADQVSIENLHLTFRETKTGSPTQFTIARLVMNRLDNEDALNLALKADYNSQPLELAGKTGRIGDVFGHRRFPLQLSGNLANADVRIKGAIDDVLTLQGIDVEARLSGKNFASLGPVVDIELPKTEAFDISGHLKGSGDSLKLDNLNGNLSGSSVNIAISGSVDNLIAFSGVDLELKGSGKDLAVMAPVIGEKIPATDQFEIQGRLTGSHEALSMKVARAEARQSNLHFSVNGSVGDIIALRGIDLQSRMTGTNLVEFGKIIGVKLPSTDQFEIQGRLTGSAKALKLLDVKAGTHQGSMRLSLTGTVKDILTLNGMDLKSRLNGKDLSGLGKVIGKKLPPTDRFEIQGRLIGSTDALAFQKAQGNAHRGSLRLSLTGAVKDLLTLDGLNVKMEASGNELAEIGLLVGTKIAPLGPFKVSCKINGTAKTIALEKINAMVDKSDFTGLAKFEFRKRPKFTIRLESSVIDFTA